MIKNAEEAREILRKHKSHTINAECMTSNPVCEEADGYLACLDGPEVTGLVEALEFLNQAFEKVEDNELVGKYIVNKHAFKVEAALAAFKNSRGGKE